MVTFEALRRARDWLHAVTEHDTDTDAGGNERQPRISVRSHMLVTTVTDPMQATQGVVGRDSKGILYGRGDGRFDIDEPTTMSSPGPLFNAKGNLHSQGTASCPFGPRHDFRLDDPRAPLEPGAWSPSLFTFKYLKALQDSRVSFFATSPTRYAWSASFFQKKNCNSRPPGWSFRKNKSHF